MKRIALILVPFLLVGCATKTDDAVSRSLTNINEELVVIQKTVTDTQMGVEDMQASTDKTNADIASNTDAIAELRSEIAYLNNEIMLLKSKTSTQPAGSASNMKQTGSIPNIIMNDDGTGLNVDISSDDQTQQIIIIEDSSAAKNSIYSYAIELNRQRKYKEAREKFEEFLAKYPNDPLAGNAQYWIGETYYSMDDMPNALTAFQTVLTKYPRSNKVPDSMLKVGYVYDKTGKRDQSVSTLKQLVQKYPKSRPATLATQRLKSWGM